MGRGIADNKRRRLLEAGHYPHNGLLGYGQDQGYQDLLHPPPHHPDRQPMDWRRIEPGYHGVHPPRGGGGNLVPIEDMDYGIGDYYRPHFGDHYGYHDPHRPRFEPRDEYWKPGRHLRQSNSEGRVPDHHDIGHFGMDRGRGRDRSGDDVRYGNGLEGTSGAGSRYLDDDTSESDNESFERRNWV